MINYKKYLPYFIAVLFFIVSAYLFSPQVFEKKVVNQSDIASWRGMANEIISYNEANPKDDQALWTNSMFSGMPATSISVIYKGDYTDYIYKLIHKLSGTRPPSYLLISMIGGFLLFLAFGINVPLSAIGAFALTFCSYNLQIIQVGHNSKMVAIAFIPWVLAAVVYTYRRRGILGTLFGALLFAFALNFQIKANHPQITYYLAIMVLGFGVAKLYSAIKERYFATFLKQSLILFAAGLLGIATNINHLWPTYEYSKYTMRGGSELATEEGKDQKGLEISYATSWSYSLEEMPNLMIPNFNGGSSSGELSTNSETYKVLRTHGYRGAEQVIKQMPLYWGPQPFTAGPMYMGAISVFIFVLGLILLRGPVKWWLAGVSLLAVLLSWGSNLLFLTEFFFKYIPMYNKFRTVSMVLVILQITIPLLGWLALSKLLGKEERYGEKEAKRGMSIALIITAGFSLIFALIPSLAGSFTSSADSQMPDVLRDTLVRDRMSLLRGDAVRSLVFILLGASALWFTYKGKLRQNLFYGALALLVVADMWAVGKRYLNDMHFIKSKEFENQYALRPVDRTILEDRDASYRVLDLSINTFNDAHVSYHHKTIGGYSPAKMQRYQDLIEYHITPEIRQIAQDIKECTTIDEAQEALGNYPVLNMLNARYIVLTAENPPLVNIRSYGNSWFANNFIIVNSAIEEIDALNLVESSSTAVVHNEFADIVSGCSHDSLSARESICLTEYSPNKLSYHSSSTKERIALFSEVYYPAGWKAYIDGEEARIFRADYLLRALKIPTGEHLIVFEFKPESFTKGAMWSRVSSGALILLMLATLAGILYKKIKKIE